MYFKRVIKQLLIMSLIISFGFGSYLTLGYAFNANHIDTPITNNIAINNQSKLRLEISSVTNSTFAIVSDDLNGDRLYAWGQNKNGKLGIGNEYDTIFPQLCEFNNLPAKAKITGVYSGGDFSAVVVNDTALYLAGANDSGQLGNGVFSDQPVHTFTRNDMISDLNGHISHVSIGASHILVVVDQQVYAWGKSDKGQVGNGSIANVNIPTAITGINGTNYHAVVATATNSYVWIDNQLYAWGISGMVGNGSNFFSEYTPVRVNLSSGTITSFSASSSQQCLLVLDGTKLYAWGSQYRGQLGNGQNTTFVLLSPTPIPFALANNQTIKQTYSGNYFSAIQIDQQLYLTGFNSSGQLCNDTETISTSYQPMLNYTPNATTIYRLSADWGMAITDQVTKFWGNNISGNFGNGEQISYNPTPKLLDAFGPVWVEEEKDNTSITASAALNNLYQNNQLNTAALANYIDLNQFPPNTQLTIAPNTIPVADDTTQTITLSISPNQAYYAQPDGAKVAAYTPFTVVIQGFAPIPVKPDPDPNPDPSEQPKQDLVFPWWWIIIGISGFLLIILATYLILRFNRRHPSI